MTQIEWLAAALVLINVALVALRSVWNYPFALVAVSLYAIVFYDARLYSDMVLQGFFFALNLYGWASWLRAKARRVRSRSIGLSSTSRMARRTGSA